MSHFGRPRKRRHTVLAAGHTYPARVLEVVDGDSVRMEVFVGNTLVLTEVRLFGIDAPEHDQPHGGDASRALARLVFAHSDWRLEVRAASDRYGRTIGLLYSSAGRREESVNRQLVHQGMAFWDPEYAPKGEYGIGVAELSARTGRRGLWKDARSGGVRPWDHRWKSDDESSISEQREGDSKAANAKIAELEQRLAHVTTQSRSSKHELDRAKARVSLLERQLEDLVLQSYEWKRERFELLRESKRLADSVEQYKMEINHLYDERSRLQQSLLEAEISVRARFIRLLFRR